MLAAYHRAPKEAQSTCDGAGEGQQESTLLLLREEREEHNLESQMTQSSAEVLSEVSSNVRARISSYPSITDRVLAS